MEEIAITITTYISLSLEIAAAIVVAVAMIKLITHYLFTFYKAGRRLFEMEARIKFGSAVAISLELLLGADVLETAVAPAWDDICKLAAIATIRTVLNYFLEKELKHSKTTG